MNVMGDRLGVSGGGTGDIPDILDCGKEVGEISKTDCGRGT